MSDFEVGDRVVRASEHHFLGKREPHSRDYGETEAKKGAAGKVIEHGRETGTFRVRWDLGGISAINGTDLLPEPEQKQEPKSVTLKQVNEVLKQARKANKIYDNPEGLLEDYNAAVESLHRTLAEIANG